MHAGLAEALELGRGQLRQRDRLGELQLALVGLEGVLVELVDVLQQPGGAGEAAPVGRLAVAAAEPVAGRLPVVGLDERRRHLLALEGELVGGELSHRGRLLEEEAVDPLQHAAHPVVELDVGELCRQEVDHLLGVLGLHLGDHALLLDDAHVIFGDLHLLCADPNVLLGQSLLEFPLF